MGASKSKELVQPTKHGHENNLMQHAFTVFMNTHMEEQPVDDRGPPWTMPYMQFVAAYMSFLSYREIYFKDDFNFHRHVHEMTQICIQKNENMHLWGIGDLRKTYTKNDYIGLYISGLRLSKVPTVRFIEHTG